MQFALLIYGAESDNPDYRDQTHHDTPAWQAIMATHDAASVGIRPCFEGPPPA